jgi:hypothetical protein
MCWLVVVVAVERQRDGPHPGQVGVHTHTHTHTLGWYHAHHPSSILARQPACSLHTPANALVWLRRFAAPPHRALRTTHLRAVAPSPQLASFHNCCSRGLVLLVLSSPPSSMRRLRCVVVVVVFVVSATQPVGVVQLLGMLQHRHLSRGESEFGPLFRGLDEFQCGVVTRATMDAALAKLGVQAAPDDIDAL